MWRVFGADFNDALHVRAFGPDQAAGHLKFLVVIDLNVEPTGVLNGALVVGRGLLGRAALRRLLLSLVKRLVAVHILGLKLSLLLLRVEGSCLVGGLSTRRRDALLGGRGALVRDLASFARNPLDYQGRIVLGEVVVIERLLGEESVDEVLEGNQRELLLLVIDHSHVSQLSKHPEHLQHGQIAAYVLEVLRTQLEAGSFLAGLRGETRCQVLLLRRLAGLDVEAESGVLGGEVVFVEDLNDALQLLLRQVELLALVGDGREFLVRRAEGLRCGQLYLLVVQGRVGVKMLFLQVVHREGGRRQRAVVRKLCWAVRRI